MTPWSETLWPILEMFTRCCVKVDVDVFYMLKSIVSDFLTGNDWIQLPNLPIFNVFKLFVLLRGQNTWKCYMDKAPIRQYAYFYGERRLFHFKTICTLHTGPGSLVFLQEKCKHLGVRKLFKTHLHLFFETEVFRKKAEEHD